MAAAASTRDGYRGGLPAEPDGHGGGGDRRGHRDKTVAAGAVAPNAANELDCNGWSKAYATVRKLAGATCVNPVTVKNGKRFRFEDNGHYIGHDEPSVKFISSTRGSGNTMSYLTKMPVDPQQVPDPERQSHELRPAVHRALVRLADVRPELLPAERLRPGQRHQHRPGSADRCGSAFMELQFYPPGYTPFIDTESCSATKWCAALNIDSLECSFNFATCNNNCIEPVNFAFLQTNGVPAGPPSPQLDDVSTFLPNAHTLMINPGDTLPSPSRIRGRDSPRQSEI